MPCMGVYYNHRADVLTIELVVTTACRLDCVCCPEAKNINRFQLTQLESWSNMVRIGTSTEKPSHTASAKHQRWTYIS